MNDDRHAPVEIRGGVELPAIREEIELHTADGLTPRRRARDSGRPAPGRDPRHAASAADRRRLHGLAHPPQGGRPAARARRPRGAAVQHPRHDLAARHERRRRSARASPSERMSRRPWRSSPSAGCRTRGSSGWSFGTELALKYGLEHGIDGAILLSPPLHRTSDEELAALGRRRRPRSSRSSPSSTTTCGPPRRPSASRCCRGCDASTSTAASTSGWGSRRRGACSRRSSRP